MNALDRFISWTEDQGIETEKVTYGGEYFGPVEHFDAVRVTFWYDGIGNTQEQKEKTLATLARRKGLRVKNLYSLPYVSYTVFTVEGAEGWEDYRKRRNAANDTLLYILHYIREGNIPAARKYLAEFQTAVADAAKKSEAREDLAWALKLIAEAENAA